MKSQLWYIPVAEIPFCDAMAWESQRGHVVQGVKGFWELIVPNVRIL